ncbi:MAG: LPS export ABC transporter periplasmic protein LptC [Kiritimatiellae bacterium]|jgi:hypothetical protein|nr:LPS export ABC transporter periplasmic protein LptC [Kiritimatiellia bacterium]
MQRKSSKILVLLLATFACGVLFGQLTGRLPVKGVRFPVEHYADGTVKMAFYADSAFIDADNQKVDASGIKVLMFNELGQEDGLILATNCFYSKETNLLTSANEIYFKKQTTTITGVGYELNIKSNSFTILNDVKMVVNDFDVTNNKKNPIELKK